MDWRAREVAAGGLQLAAYLPAGQEKYVSSRAAHAGIETPRLAPLFADTALPAPQHQDGWLLGFSALTPAEITAAVNSLAMLKRTVI